ncbi:MAG: zinc ribbon domain-containing protein [Anaerolineae bacterium]|nr:zinc ribbon domain-containing protein [Phycisphaerae bacterium]
MEGIFTVFIFFAVIVITALLFGGWVIISLVRFMLRGITAAVSPASLPPAPKPSQATIRCTNDRCRHANPAIAQFCRRCGNALPAVQRVPVRRAAMW